MSKIITVNKAIKISVNLKKDKKSIVVCGGCFDILHIGHIKFLQKAKEKGDFLFVLLENDKNVKKLKGQKRPINKQKDRAEILASINFVDFVVLLNEMKTNTDYDSLIFSLKPNVIAITKNDPQEIHNIRQAKEINAKVVSVIAKIKNKSTSKLTDLIYKNF